MNSLSLRSSNSSSSAPRVGVRGCRERPVSAGGFSFFLLLGKVKREEKQIGERIEGNVDKLFNLVKSSKVWEVEVPLVQTCDDFANSSSP